MADAISSFIAFAQAHPVVMVIAVGIVGGAFLLFGHGLRRLLGLFLIVAAVAWFTGISALGIAPHWFEVPT